MKSSYNQKLDSVLGVLHGPFLSIHLPLVVIKKPEPGYFAERCLHQTAKTCFPQRFKSHFSDIQELLFVENLHESKIKHNNSNSC